MDTIFFPNLHITLSHVGGSVRVGSFAIAFYGIIVAAGMLAGIWLVMRLADLTGQDPDRYFNFAVVTVVLSVLGARVYYVLFSWEYYSVHPAQIFDIRGGGLAIYGGVITGVICACVYTRKTRLNLWLWLDTAMPGVALGQAIGRWGNFFNREAFGEYTNSLFAMGLPLERLAAADVTEKMRAHPLIKDGISFVLVHPTFLYESLWNLVLVLLMIYATRRGQKASKGHLLAKHFDGQIFCMYLMGYGLGRFWIEGLRTDQLLLPGTTLAVSRLLSGVLFAAGTIGMLRGQRKKSV